MSIKLTEEQIKEAIVRMNNSEEYLALSRYFSRDSFLKILHVSRDEKAHSGFVAWLLNPTSDHDLNYFALQKFLQMLPVVWKKDYNAQAYFPNEYVDKFVLGDYLLCDSCEVQSEVPTGKVAGFDKEGRIDILLHLQFKGSNRVLPIIIENKVLSTENDENKGKTKKQTEKYFDWGTLEYADRTKYEHPLYIFLAPDYERDIKCKCEKFIKISYQNLIDYVIEPCLLNATNNQTKYFIESYLRCLSNSTLDGSNSRKEGRIMGIPSREMELLRKFHEKNKELFEAVLTMLENDEEDDELRKKISAARSASSSHDRSKYTLDGQEYFKGPLLVAIVDKYLSEHPNADLDELRRVFNLQLVFNKKQVILLPADAPASLKAKAPIKTLFDGTQIYVNNQVQIGDMDEVLRIARENGQIVKKV